MHHTEENDQADLRSQVLTSLAKTENAEAQRLVGGLDIITTGRSSTNLSPPKRPLVRFKQLIWRPRQADNEATPLITDATDPTDGNDPLRSGEGASSWKALSSHVKSGDILLEAAVVDQAATLDHRSRREQAQDVIRQHMDIKLKHCLIAIACYMFVAVIAFSFVFDKWTIIDSVYFSVVTFTTVGFGDLAPVSHASRVFTCMFALSGVAFLGIAIGILGNSIIDAQHEALDKATEISKKQVVTLFSNDENGNLKSPEECVEELEANVVTQPSPFHRMISEFCLVAIVLAVFGFVVSLDPNIAPKDVVYFLIITSTTCGYGDVVPESQMGRLATAMFIPIAVGAMAHWLSLLASAIIESRQSRYRTMLGTKDLTFEDLDVMDEDRDGRVTRAEFLEFILVALDKVDRELIEELRQTFSNLDVDGTGVLSKNDLVTNARKRLQDPTRKLELSRYKKQVLAQGGSRPSEFIV